MILGYFILGALVGGIIGYVSAAIISISDADDEEEENKNEDQNNSNRG